MSTLGSGVDAGLAQVLRQFTGGRLEFIAGAIIDDDQIAADLDDRDVRLRLRAVGGPAKTLGDFRELFRRRFGATTLSGMVNDPSLTTVTSASPE